MAATQPDCVHDTRVVKVLPRGRVIIDARHLRRVMNRVTGEVYMELVDQSGAEIAAETMNECMRNDHTIVVPYKAAKANKRLAVR